MGMFTPASKVSLALLAALVAPSAAFALEYFVAPSGNDSAGGGPGDPFRSIQRGIDQATPGDTITVRAGTYGGAARFSQSGAAGSPIVLRAYPGERPVIDLGGSGFPVLIESARWAERVAVGWIEVRGFELRNGAVGIELTNAHNVVLEDNWIHDNGLGILGGGHDVTIRSNRIYRNGNPATNLDHGIYLTGRRVLLANNIIYANSSYAIQVAAYGCGGHCAGTDFSGAVDWTIANNVLALEQNRAGIVLWLPDPSYGDLAGTDLRNVNVVNNIFSNNNPDNPSWASGIDFVDTAGDATIEVAFNIFYNAWNAPPLSPNSSNVHHNIIGQDPRFVAPASGDFHLQSGSPAINAGRTVALVPRDITGTTRPQGAAYDIGPFEVRDAAQSPPAAPRGLRVR